MYLDPCNSDFLSKDGSGYACIERGNEDFAHPLG